MSHPFSPTQIRFDGYGIDAARAVWARLRLGEASSPSVIVPVANINVGSLELWRRFGDLGILLGPADKKNVLQKIHPFFGSYKFKVVTSPGWNLGYVTRTRVFGPPPCIIERDFGDLDLRKYRSAGTLAQWQDQILLLCAGNSRLMFAIMCAFAGPLLGILGIGSFGFQLFGPTSIGKTIVLIVGGSVWGCRVGASSQLGFLETWATTQEGVERYGRTHKDSLLGLDETRSAGTDREVGKLIATFIMRLAQGTTKNRLVVMGQGDWRSVYLGSSNLSLVEAFLAAGLLFDDAYRVRFPDIRGDAGHGYGAFENIHGRADAGTFAKELQARACTYFGAASEAYLERLAKDRHNRRDWLVTGLRRTMARYRALVSAGSAADGRITDLFAVIYAAAMLARHYGILLWTPEQIAWAVLTCQRAHHQSVAESQTKFDPIAAVQSYIAEHLSSFRKVPDPSITRQEFERGAGFIYTDRYGATEYLVPPAVFSREFAALNSHRVMRALVIANLLVRTGDKHVSKAPIRSSTTDGREYVYRVRGRILTLVQK